MLSATNSGSCHYVLAPRPAERSLGEARPGWASAAGIQRRPWLERLRLALREDSLLLHFQPIRSLRDGSTVQFEALLRLADEPEGRLIAPGAFLGIAERYGLIPLVDQRVLELALACVAPTPERVAVNLSALSVTAPATLAHIEALLARHAMPPERLVVEITETAAISDMRRAREFCAAVRALGCSVSFDDFGVGYGALHYLTHLPFDHLKIDGNFIRSIASSRNDRLVVRALVDVARGLGKQTIAELVDNAEKVEILRELGVDHVQGFAVGRPSPRLQLSAGALRLAPHAKAPACAEPLRSRRRLLRSRFSRAVDLSLQAA